MNEAIRYYKKGYIIQEDYYNGENYAVCLVMKAKSEKISENERGYLEFESQAVFANVINVLEHHLESDDEISYWEYASLAVCYYCIGNQAKHEEYEKKFIESKKADWEEETYRETLNRIKM